MGRAQTSLLLTSRSGIGYEGSYLNCPGMVAYLDSIVSSSQLNHGNDMNLALDLRRKSLVTQAHSLLGAIVRKRGSSGAVHLYHCRHSILFHTTQNVCSLQWPGCDVASVSARLFCKL